ncbi:MAG TPA: metallopeptidase family protein [Patescibacteria group bacterium]|nr:metallopeptidase family protein [Patescibacteria group bacterium]
MVEISDTDFRKIVKRAIDAIPKRYAENIKNLAFVVEDEPNLAQRQKLKLRDDQSLYGLYEGVPLTKRGAGYNLVLPDKITIFKNPAVLRSYSLEQLEQSIHHTIWHEVAHYFGLGHDRIHELEGRY